MANITRIKNNQITDSTITYSKIAPGTLVGSVFNSNLTLNSNVTILGNLTISGTPTTIQSTNTYVNDPLVVFNNGYVGSPSYDIGIIANRNLQTLAGYGSVNVGWVWEETAAQWQAIATTETGSTTGVINNSGWSNVRVGNLISVSSNITGALLVNGATTLAGTTNLVGATTFTTATGGGLQAVAIGNVTPGTGAFTTGTFNTATTGGLQAVAIGNVTPGTGAFTTGTFSSTLDVTGATTLTTATIGGLQAVAIGNVTPGTGAFTTGTFNTATTGGLQAVAIGNVTPGTATFTSLTATGASTLNTVTAASYQGVIGNVAPNTGAFTTLTANGITTLTSGTASTTALTGALVVTGGAGVSGNIYAGGKVSVGSSEATTGVNTGAFQVPNGGAYIAGNLWVGGNINFTPNSISTITGNSAQFFGNAAGFGALYAGISSGFVYQPQTVMQNSTSFNGYAQLNHQNINNGSDATSDYVATADNGTENTYYIDFGIASSGYDNTTPTNALGTSLFPNDGYLYAQGKAGFQGGNLTVGTSIPGTIVRMIAGGVEAANVIASVSSAGFKVNIATASTSTTTGALQVAGGAGIVGAVNIGDTLTVGGTTNLASATFTTATGGGLQVAAIGNVTPGTGAFTTLTAQTETVGGLQAVAIGNVTPGTGVFTNLQATAIGGVTPGTGAFTTLTTGGLQAVAIGNVTPGTGAFTSLSASGTLGVTGATTLTTATTGGLQAVAIGNVTPGTGAFTTLAASGATTFTSTTESSNTTTGAVVVSGGVGIAKNLNVGGNAVITGNLTVQGTMTAIQSQTLDVTDLNITVAKGAGSAAAANGAGITVDAANATFTYANADDSWNVNKFLKGTKVSLSDTTDASSSTTGALIVSGGAGIAKQLYAGGGIQGTVIGNATPAAATFTAETVTGTSTLNTVTAASYQGVIGNVTPAAGSFTSIVGTGATVNGTLVATTVNAATIGNVGSKVTGDGGFLSNIIAANVVGTINTANVAYYNAITNLTNNQTYYVEFANVTSGNSVTGAVSSVTINPSTGTLSATTLSGAVSASTINATGASTLNTVTAASYQGVIGNVTPASATFTTATIQQGIQNTAIGNVTPNTGAFTTLSASEWANITATTTSTSHTTGALLVAGGVGIQGNLSAGTAVSYHRLGGNLLLGNPSGGFSGELTSLQINQNPDAPQSSTSALHISAKSGFNGKVTIDSFGNGVSSTFVSRASRGSSATPAATQLGDTIGGLITRGYGSTGYLINSPGTSAGLVARAAENFTDSAQGQTLLLQTVKIGSNTASVAMKFDASGNIVIPATEGSSTINDGALVVKGGVGIGANVNIGGNLSVSNFISGNSGLQVTGTISTVSTTDTTAPGVGTIITPGGASIGGNVYVGKNLYIGPASFDKALSTPTIIGVDNGSQYAQMAMVNSSANGSSDFAAYTSNGDDNGGWVDMGIAGDSFNDGNYTITKPQDGYLFTKPTTNTVGGNLVLATSEVGNYKDVVIGVGSFHSNAEVARFHGNTSTSGTFTLKLLTDSVPAANTGAFQVWGGESISGNSYVGGAMTINGSQTANYDFVVKGKSNSSLIWARPGASYDQVVIGGSLTPSGLTGGSKLTINSTDSILLPSGTTGQRPGSSGFTDVEGMFRYNTTLGAIEWFTGALWQTVSTTFTVITDEQFIGDGSTSDFTLNGPTTTAATIVSINGVVQIPTLAYSITGAGSTTLEFTEAPAADDVIDVRRLTTTQTLLGVASQNGKNAFQTDNNGVYIYTGSTGSRITTSWDTAGNEISNRANVTVASANTATTIVTMDATLYRSGKFVIQATHGTDYQVMEALVVHDGTTASVVPYGVVQTNGNLGIVSATYTSGNVLLQFVSSNTSTVVRTKSDFITI